MKSARTLAVLLMSSLLLLAACAGGGAGTALGVEEDFREEGDRGTYRLQATSLSGQYRIGPPADRVDAPRKASIEVRIKVKNEHGRLVAEFAAPPNTEPLVMELKGGEVVTGSGVGLVSGERVLVGFDAFKVGAGRVEVNVDFEYLD